jgi:hypothetical protein
MEGDLRVIKLAEGRERARVWRIPLERLYAARLG